MIASTTEQISSLQAFNTLQKLLKLYFQETDADDLALLLSGMSFLEDGSTADPAAWEEWEEDVVKKKNTLSKQEAYNAAIEFLAIFYNSTSSEITKHLIDELRKAKSCDDLSIPIVARWNTCLGKALAEPEESRDYLQLTKD